MTTVTMRDDHYPDAVLPVDAEFTQQYVRGHGRLGWLV
jgi:hypothetical protein